MKRIPFGLIGGGLMGREFASAAARWSHLLDFPARPELVAVCSRHPERLIWFRDNFPTISQVTGDYRELLANPGIAAVYVAVPHHLHREIYGAAITAGKQLMGEKPFGIDLAAYQAIADALRQHPQVFARCSSQFPFFPAVQRIGDWLAQGEFGRIIEVNSGFLHSSDLDPQKPINWKRQLAYNGEYGSLGDLGLHACHVPFRAGWVPRNVRAIFSQVVSERPDAAGNRVLCQTPDNATLLCETYDHTSGEVFPWTLKTQRIAPGQKNTWYLEILGTRASARFSTAQPKLLQLLKYTGGEQVWGQIQMGYEPAFKTISGGIFEFGFTDAILQMWAAFLYELEQGRPLKKFAGCATPAEAGLSHRLFTAAFASHRNGSVVAVPPL